MDDFESRRSKKEKLKSRMISVVRDYDQESRQSEEERERDEAPIKKEKKSPRDVGGRIKSLLIIIGIILLVAAVWQLYIRFYGYKGYSVIQSREISFGSTVGFSDFGGGILKYSKDGAAVMDRTGREVWVESYGMKDPVLSVSGDYAVIADRGGNDIVVLDRNKKLCNIKTVLPLTRLTSANNGVSAVIAESARAAYVYIYDKNGIKLADLEFLMSESGYPTDIVLSPDGSRLMVSLQYINGDKLSGRVAFYDFSDKGENIQNRLVGGFDDPFGESLIGKVYYLNETYSCAVADTGLYFFSSKNLLSPEIVKEYLFDTEIRSICKEGENVAVVLLNDSSEYLYKLMLFNASGDKILSKDFDFEYRYLDMDEDYVFLYNDTAALFYNKSGTAKFKGDIDFQVIKFLKGGLPNEFILVGTTQIKTVKLR